MTLMALMTLILPLVFNLRNLRHLRYQRFRQCFNQTIKIQNKSHRPQRQNQSPEFLEKPFALHCNPLGFSL